MFASNALCEACLKGKFSKTSSKDKNGVSTSRPLQLLHTDLFGLVKTASVNGKLYGLVSIYNYITCTCVKFLTHKDKSHYVLATFCT